METALTILVRSIIALYLLLQPLCSSAQVALEAQIETIASGITGRVGVYALVIQTGEAVSYHGEDRYPMQSVYKFPIGMAVLDRVDKGGFPLIGKSVWIPQNIFLKVGTVRCGTSSRKVRVLL
jgi:beta-lactamase class A